jgi:hypothetical protein
MAGWSPWRVATMTLSLGERAERVGEYWRYTQSRAIAAFLIDCGEDPDAPSGAGWDAGRDGAQVVPSNKSKPQFGQRLEGTRWVIRTSRLRRGTALPMNWVSAGSPS